MSYLPWNIYPVSIQGVRASKVRNGGAWNLEVQNTTLNSLDSGVARRLSTLGSDYLEAYVDEGKVAGTLGDLWGRWK